MFGSFNKEAIDFFTLNESIARQKRNKAISECQWHKSRFQLMERSWRVFSRLRNGGLLIRLN